MAGWDDVTTYEQLTREERLAHFKASIVRELDTLPELYKRRVEAQDARVLVREERLVPRQATLARLMTSARRMTLRSRGSVVWRFRQAM
jgi:hypothetical protein